MQVQGLGQVLGQGQGQGQGQARAVAAAGPMVRRIWFSCARVRVRAAQPSGRQLEVSRTRAPVRAPAQAQLWRRA